jgi:hypothetical protein
MSDFEIYNEIGIQFKVDPETNELLTKAARKSGRSKKVESMMRLKDHLLSHKNLVSIGHRI